MPATSTETQPPAAARRYTVDEIELVKREYPGADSKKKLEICRKLGIKDKRRLYNLAHQLGLTRKSIDLNDKEFREFVNGNQDVMMSRRSYTAKDEQTVLQLREDPATTVFEPWTDEFIREWYSRMPVTLIAIKQEHSEAAVMYRARHLTRQRKDSDGNLMPPQAVRRPAIGFTLERVCAWLGISEAEVPALQAAGVEIHPLLTPRGEEKGKWVLSASLAPFLRKYGARLVRDKNACQYFIAEILETEEQLKANRPRLEPARLQMMDALESDDPDQLLAAQDAMAAARLPLEREGVIEESCHYVDHGHICRNPSAGPLYEEYCPHGADKKCFARDVRFDLID